MAYRVNIMRANPAKHMLFRLIQRIESKASKTSLKEILYNRGLEEHCSS